MLITWDVKSLMHNNKDIAKKILSGEKFWDLGQAAFLLNPLSREQPSLAALEEEYQKQLLELKNYPKLFEVLTGFDLPLIPVLYKMERRGMRIDREYFSKLAKEYAAEVEKLEKDKAEATVDSFIHKGVILPAQRETAIKLCLNDNDTFLDLYRDAKPIVDTTPQRRSVPTGTAERIANYFKN